MTRLGKNLVCSRNCKQGKGKPKPEPNAKIEKASGSHSHRGPLQGIRRYRRGFAFDITALFTSALTSDDLNTPQARVQTMSYLSVPVQNGVQWK